MTAHTTAELRRIEAYRIRLTVTNPGRLTLRNPATGELDGTAIAIELTMRDNAELPHYIQELDAPPENRNPSPWPYCPALLLCPQCTIALAAELPREPSHVDTRRPTRLARILQWIADGIDALTARLNRRGRP